jgi:rhodanese-related sulfurtransferase
MSDGHAKRLDAVSLHERMEAGQAVVVLDVRTADARTLHPEQIPGARWLPLADVTRLGGLLPRDSLIATYCT